MKIQGAIEYAHHVGSMFIWSAKKKCRTELRDFVRKEPPLMSAVKPSARSLRGNMHHNEYRPMRSVILDLVVRLMPKKRDLALFMIARTIPLNTTRRAKSIRKKKKDPFIVLSVTATKYRKKIGYQI